jgi:hypothetical protein
MLTYIASPYSAENAKLMEMRYVAVTKFTAEGLKQKHVLLSPITYCHQMAQLGQMGTDAAYWWELNQKWLALCDNMLVYGIDGWTESKGVFQEVEFMTEVLRRPAYLWTCEPSAPNYEVDVHNFWRRFPTSTRRVVTTRVAGGGLKIIARSKANALDQDAQAN